MIKTDVKMIAEKIKINNEDNIFEQVLEYLFDEEIIEETNDEAFELAEKITEEVFKELGFQKKIKSFIELVASKILTNENV